jgi:hypothetical protein
MNETTQQYIARIRGYLGDQDARAVLETTPARLRSLITSATPAQLTWTSSPTRWTITQIIAHLADAEIVAAWRYRTVLEKDDVRIQAYDQNVWASSFGYEQVPPAESLGLLSAVDPSRLQHKGLHSERGEESITRIMEMYAGHDLNHLAQIERLLEESRNAAAAAR